MATATLIASRTASSSALANTCSARPRQAKVSTVPGSTWVPRPSAWASARREDARNIKAAFHGSASNPASSTFAEATVEEIMSPHPVLLNVGTSCKEAARALLANDCSSAAVVDKDGRLLGVLSESDLLWKGAGAPLDHTIIPPVFVGAFDLLISLRDSAQVQHELDKILARTVEQAMTKDPVTIGPDATLSEAAKTLLANKVHSLPVVDNQRRVVGILSQHDALRGMVAQQLPLL